MSAVFYIFAETIISVVYISKPQVWFGYLHEPRSFI